MFFRKNNEGISSEIDLKNHSSDSNDPSVEEIGGILIVFLRDEVGADILQEAVNKDRAEP